MRHMHHIVPRHRDGTNDSYNLISLTVTQHAMWHYAEWQLHRCEYDKLAWMGLSGIIGKEEIIESINRMPKSLESINKCRETKKLMFSDPVLGPELRRKIGEKSRGRKHNPETKSKISQSLTGKIRKPPTEETRSKIGAANRGKVRSEEDKKKKSESLKGIKKSLNHAESIRQSRIGTKWWFNPLTGQRKCVKISPGLEWILGRG